MFDDIASGYLQIPVRMVICVGFNLELYTKLVKAARNTSLPTPKKRVRLAERSDVSYSPRKRVSTAGGSSPRRLQPEHKRPERFRDEEDELIEEHDLLNDTGSEMEMEE